MTTAAPGLLQRYTSYTRDTIAATGLLQRGSRAFLCLDLPGSQGLHGRDAQLIHLRGLPAHGARARGRICCVHDADAAVCPRWRVRFQGASGAQGVRWGACEEDKMWHLDLCLQSLAFDYARKRMMIDVADIYAPLINGHYVPYSMNTAHCSWLTGVRGNPL